MLKQAIPGCEPEDFLLGKEPHPVQFPNHHSTEKHAGYVRQEVQKAIDMGVIARWTPEMGSPTVVNGLRVVESKGGRKLRLCMNPMYPNLFMKIPPVKYETIADVCGFVQEGDWLFTTDDTSGYWNLLLHPSMYPIAAFELSGEIFYFRAMAFGFAPACWVYTLLKQELLRPLRTLSWDLAYLIDDLLSAARSEPEAQFGARLLVRLLTALGFTLGAAKCQLRPAHQARFLGFIVDAEKQALKVPEDKVQGLVALVVGLETQVGAGEPISYRQVAQVAGKIMAMSPAVSLAPLHARVVGQALVGKAAWDAALPDPSMFLQRARIFLSLLELKNGRTWWAKPSPTRLRAVGDASELGFGGLLPDGELGAASSFYVPFTPDQARRMMAGDFSSTEREVSAMGVCLKWIEASRPELTMSSTIQYQTDSQSAMFCVLGMKGAAPCLRAVDELLCWCAERDLELEVVWYPRESNFQEAADALSKHPDLTQWQLRAEVFDSLWMEPCLGGRQPTVDAFADERSTKLPKFYSPTWSPNSAGIDAFAQPWGGPDQLLYINPPFQLMGRVVRKIRDEQANCVLVTPIWPRWWMVTLNRMPVRARHRLPHSGLFECPKGAGGTPMVKSPRYAVEALYIIWD
ncbi:hypothetical protein Vretimale_19753 [Volvox reticuliferus]|uniref:Reverse transcriptase domain-containing protein n=1 Tax=Volvox reticuliferus TaxID=1737510 RepID=A0A8J4D725_9CHLO|nr:hypothetical protein Vretifemale_20737 [Volvox reticuliferus]GIM17242.1 hypothetical protein Vretimale_19753 [Volvox reticuliferus]